MLALFGVYILVNHLCGRLPVLRYLRQLGHSVQRLASLRWALKCLRVEINDWKMVVMLCRMSAQVATPPNKYLLICPSC